MRQALVPWVRGISSACLVAALALGSSGTAQAQSADLVVTIEADQPAYMGEDMEHFQVTISNNGPDTATNVVLTVDHPLADQPYETSATCQPLPGPNPNGPALCPQGSGTAPSPAFTRSGTQLSITVDQIPSQAAVRIEFDNASRCPDDDDRGGGAADFCLGLPQGNFVVTADVSADENEVDPITNHASTNIYIYPPDIQYKIKIVDWPATANPGDIIEYEFDVTSFGLQPSDLLRLRNQIKGLPGDMTPLNLSNNPYGAMGSTLQGTELQKIELVSCSLGTWTDPVFIDPAVSCTPVNGTFAIPMPTSTTNMPPIQGFPSTDVIANLPGTLHGGGVLRFKSTVKVGDPVCVTAPESGYRELEFEVNVSGLFGTDTAPPSFADNTDQVITQVPATCHDADIEFETSANPPSMTLDASTHEADWEQVSVVTNNGTGTAVNVPVSFQHFSNVVTETPQPITCSDSSGSTPPAYCPSISELLAGTTHYSAGTTFNGTIASLPAGQSVVFKQQVTVRRDSCWPAGVLAGIDLRGHALPSPALHDPLYDPTTAVPPFYASGTNTYYINNGMQALATVDGLVSCPGNPGGGTHVPILISKHGPYATAADATSGGSLIGQTPGDAIPDGTEIFFRIEVSNPDGDQSVEVGRLQDDSFPAPAGLLPGASGFVPGGSTLGSWGINCTASPASQHCHELASGGSSTVYNPTLLLNYDDQLHGGEDYVALAPLAKLTYVVPFTLPTHLKRCGSLKQVNNKASVRYRSADQPDNVHTASTEVSSPVSYHIGDDTPCASGVLELEKKILPPADASFIPASGQISYELTLSNVSSTETLDVAHLVDSISAFGSADLALVGVSCSPSGGAQCPPTPIVAGMRTPAVGTATPLPNAWDIDHEWGQPGDNTFPPGSSLKFTITYQLDNPSKYFSCVWNEASFSGENDPTGWVPDSDTASICVPMAPELSLQKKVSPQIAPPGSLVTYTLIVTNIGTAAADGAQITDPMPLALQPYNLSGYTNVTCTDISGNVTLPAPVGSAGCGPIINNNNELKVTINPFGPNSVIQITYQAQVPDVPDVPVSIENQATVTPLGTGGYSFGSGTARSHQNVQVIAAAGGNPPITGEPVLTPALDRWSLLLLALGFLTLGGWLARRATG